MYVYIYHTHTHTHIEIHICRHTYVCTYTHDGLLQSQALNMVTFNVAKQNVSYFIETF